MTCSTPAAYAARQIHAAMQDAAQMFRNDDTTGDPDNLHLILRELRSGLVYFTDTLSNLSTAAHEGDADNAKEVATALADTRDAVATAVNTLEAAQSTYPTRPLF